jgi:hypothetical protein
MIDCFPLTRHFVSTSPTGGEVDLRYHLSPSPLVGEGRGEGCSVKKVMSE